MTGPPEPAAAAAAAGIVVVVQERISLGRLGPAIHVPAARGLSVLLDSDIRLDGADIN
jgi:hypothetical protein